METNSKSELTLEHTAAVVDGMVISVETDGEEERPKEELEEDDVYYPRCLLIEID